MVRRLRSAFVLTIVVAAFLLSACGGGKNQGRASASSAEETKTTESSEGSGGTAESTGNGTESVSGGASDAGTETAENTGETSEQVGEPLDADARKAAETAIEAVRNEDLKALGACAGFPLYVDTGEGLEVTSEEELLTEFQPEQIFTKEFKDAVTGTDLDQVRAVDGGAVLSENGGRPNLILTLTDDGWCITGINVEP